MHQKQSAKLPDPFANYTKEQLRELVDDLNYQNHLLSESRRAYKKNRNILLYVCCVGFVLGAILWRVVQEEHMSHIYQVKREFLITHKMEMKENTDEAWFDGKARGYKEAWFDAFKVLFSIGAEKETIEEAKRVYDLIIQYPEPDTLSLGL